jgi:ferric enterobactin receptor
MKTLSFFQAFGAAVLTAGLPLAAQAQTPGSVTGTLLDGANQQGLPFANVVLLRAQDSTLATGTATNETGRFRLEKVAPGTYTLRATVLGYQPLRRPVTVGANGAEVTLGSVVLRPVVTELRGVTVTGEKAAVQESLDKKVINVEKDLSSVGGTAVNVLQNVPSVTVAADGTVSLRGSSNLTILIDGKPSGAANGGGGNRLEQIPASSIEKVEVVTNPSARYDAAGAGGVINIILKKQKKDGWNGQAALTVGTQDKYNGSLSLNRRAGKVNYFGSVDGRDMLFRSRMSTDQDATMGGQRVLTDQTGRNLRHNRNYGGRLGFDLTLPANQSLTVAVQPNLNRGLNSGTQAAIITNATGTRQINSAFSSRENVSNTDMSADYRRSWEQHKGRELSASATYTYLDADVLVSQRNTEGSATDDLREWKQQFLVGLHGVAGQVDYTHPLGEKIRLDAGLKGQFQTNSGTGDFLQQRPDGGFDRVADRSYAYDFREYTQAGYATYQREMGPWSVQGGLRAEYTNTSGAVQNGQGAFRLNYLNLFPSGSLVRNIKKYDQRLQLSYSRRLNRPNFMQLLAFPLWQDQRSYRIGDPTLRPEYINALELGHQMTLGQTNVTSTLFWRQTTNAIQRLTSIDEAASQKYGDGALITAQSAQNFGEAYSYGAELSLNQPLAKWWRLTANGSLFQTNVTAATGNESSRRTVSGTGRVMNSFTPTPKLDIQVTGMYRAATITSQGRFAPQGSVDLALRQRLFNDRAALTLRVSDLFNTLRGRTESFVQTPEQQYAATSYNKWESRVGYLGFSWYLGKNKPPKKIENAPQGGGGGFGG